MFSRREALLSTLFGGGLLGLRTLATGLPAALLLNPRKALAQVPPASCGAADKAQYVVFATSASGDPINANVPGTYEDPGIAHSGADAMKPSALSIAGKSYTAAAAWKALPQGVLDRTTFWHLMTNTPVHPKETDVLTLMNAVARGEMFPSLLAKRLAPCLGTVQAQPISVGAAGPTEGLRFDGAALPTLPPLSLKATLLNPAGPLSTLLPLRDQTMNKLYDIYKNGASPAQKAYVDSLVTSQAQVRAIHQDLLDALSSIKSNDVTGQITAAVALIRMKVTPVVGIHIPFGGDNHNDADLARETSETVDGVAAIASLMAQLGSAGLSDQVTFMSLNVFGRTLRSAGYVGRSHNPNHQVSLTIGKPFGGGVIGGLTPVGSDFGATAIDAATGKMSMTGDIKAVDTLASFGKTALKAFGVADAQVATDVPTGKVIAGAIA